VASTVGTQADSAKVLVMNNRNVGAGVCHSG